MNKKFEVVLLEEALSFIDSLDLKTRKKIYYNLDKARYGNDPKLF
jgi:phage-related protein